MVRPFRFGLQARELSDAGATAPPPERPSSSDMSSSCRSITSVRSIRSCRCSSPLRRHHGSRSDRSSSTTSSTIRSCWLAPWRAPIASPTDASSSGSAPATWPPNTTRSGLPLRDPAARVRRFAESISVLRALLDDGAVSFDGEFHHVALDELGVRPVQPHVPFLIGGHGPAVVRLAARHADIFQFTGLTHGDGGVPSPGGFDIAASASVPRGWPKRPAIATTRSNGRRSCR